MSVESPPAPARPRAWAEFLLAFVVALVALAPTTGDFGLTYDEPAYSYSQGMSIQWWGRLSTSRSWGDVAPLLDADTLLYYWPYARHGINFHPPLAGQANLTAYAFLNAWLGDI